MTCCSVSKHVAGKGFVIGPNSGKAGQKTVMQVDNSTAGIFPARGSRKHTHVTGENDVIDFVFITQIDKPVVVNGSVGTIVCGNRLPLDVKLLSQRATIRPVAEHHRWLRRHPYFTGLCGVLALTACIPYLLSTIPDASIALSRREGFFESLLVGLSGARLFSFLHFGDFFIPEIYSSSFFIDGKLMIAFVSLSALVLVPWSIGVIGGAVGLSKKWASGDSWSVPDRLTALALMSITTYTAFFAVTGHAHHPHYVNSVWFAYFLIIWQGFDLGLRVASAWVKGLLTIQVAILAFMLTMTILFIHRTGGNQGIHYGPTMSTQIDVVRKVLQYSPRSRIFHAVPNYQRFPHAFYTLIALLRPVVPEADRPVRTIYIEPARDPLQGWLQVRVSEQSPDKPPARQFGQKQDT